MFIHIANDYVIKGPEAQTTQQHESKMFYTTQETFLWHQDMAQLKGCEINEAAVVWEVLKQGTCWASHGGTSHKAIRMGIYTWWAMEIIYRWRQPDVIMWKMS